MKRVVMSFVLPALLAFGAAGAAAEPVQQFAVQLKDVTPDGRYSLVFTSNSFDTTGGPPPALTAASMRFPKGIAIKPRFLRRDRLCETGKLRGALLDSETAGHSYGEMLRDLPKTQKRIARTLTPGGRAILDRCRKAYFGRGKVLVDARPQYPDAVPGLLYLFLSEPTARGAVAGISVMSLYDRSSPVASDDVGVTDLQPVFTLNLFNEPTPDGLYGYRLKLLPENVRNLSLSVAELRVESEGIVATTEKRTCTIRRQGRCVRHAVRRTSDFWADPPDCPASGKLRFKADYRYRTGLQTSSVVQIPCPRFRR